MYLMLKMLWMTGKIKETAAHVVKDVVCLLRPEKCIYSITYYSQGYVSYVKDMPMSYKKDMQNEKFSAVAVTGATLFAFHFTVLL